MATLAPLTSSTRLPFRSLDGARLRNMTNVKNRQNALPVTLASGVKRPISPSFDDNDSENVDPSILSSNKKSKNFSDYPLNPGKSSQFASNNAFTLVRASEPTKRLILTPKRPNAVRNSLAAKPKSAQPSSVPAAAGRSPKSKRVGGLLSRRRTSSSPFTRVDPPMFAGSNGLPFSIDAALSSTVSSYRPQKSIETPSLENCVPKGWMFDIHEDTEVELDDLVFEHDTNKLDISDDSDEEGNPIMKDTRGKENIPPGENSIIHTAVVATIRPVSRKDMMTDEPRTPLGDLDAKDFYADGCDDSSVIVIPAVTPDDNLNTACDVKDYTTINAVERYPDSHNGWMDLLSHGNKQPNATVDLAISCGQDSSKEVDIDIWESDSAKAEEEGRANEAASVLS